MMCVHFRIIFLYSHSGFDKISYTNDVHVGVRIIPYPIYPQEGALHLFEPHSKHADDKFYLKKGIIFWTVLTLRQILQNIP